MIAKQSFGVRRLDCALVHDVVVFLFIFYFASQNLKAQSSLRLQSQAKEPDKKA
jgi:hypothetical protein